MVSLAAACTCKKEAPPVPPVASVVSREGAVKVERGGKSADAAPKTPLFTGDVLFTGAKSSCVIRYADGTQLQVAELTRFRLGGVPGKLTVEIEEGSIVSDARGGGGLRVVTRYGAAEVLRGSEVQFNLSVGGGSMDVAFGEIRLVGEDGGEQVLAAGGEFDLFLKKPKSAPDAGVAAAAPAPEAPEQFAVTLSAPKGAALVRPKGKSRFAPAQPSAPIEPGTEFQVRKGGSALLAASGMELSVGSSRGSFGEAVREGGVERYAIGLEDGEGALRLPGETERQLTLTGHGRTAVLRTREESQLVVRQGRSGTEVEVLSGEIELSAASGPSTAVRAGGRAVISAKGVETGSPIRPAVVLPHSKKVRVYSEALAAVGLAVPEAQPAPRVEVARDAQFSKLLLAGRVYGEAVTVEPPRSGELFWRALDGQGAVIAKGQARFDRDNAASPVEKPVADVAETGLKASVFFQSAPPALAFSFQPREGASRYRVRVYRSGDLKTPVAEKAVSEPRCTFEAGAIGEGDYVWYAAPLDPNGTELAGGRMNKLEIVYDNSRTTLAIAHPRQGEAGGKAVPVSGVAPLGSKLYVNGKSAPLDAKGRFSLQLERAETVVFRLVAEGQEAFWVRQLRRHP